TGTIAPTADLTEEAWNKVIAVNLTGVWLCMRAELTAMLPRGRGAIVNNSSVLGQVGMPHFAAYTATKHGLLGLTRVAALEYSPKGIRVNLVCPGFIETPMLDQSGLVADPKDRAAAEGLHALKRLGRPEEVASAVLFLCSDEASFITGHPLMVDGGYLAR
ncbi:MAG: SDR family oxidoreductase, partial [Myxococcaceae bacterium]